MTVLSSCVSLTIFWCSVSSVVSMNVSFVESMSKGLKMVSQPWVACPKTLKGSQKDLAKLGFGVTSPDFWKLLEQSQKGIFLRSRLILCLEDYANTDERSPKDVLNKLVLAHELNAVESDWIVAVSESNFAALQQHVLSIRVDQRVYFFNTDSNMIWEMYTLKGKSIRHELGTLQNMTKESFVFRRSDFRGVHLIGHAGMQPPYFRFPVSWWRDKNNWITTPSGDLKEITNAPNTGLFADILKILEADMNFKTDLYIRRDWQWGNLVNGTWNGMIGSVMRGEADLIAASLTFTLTRFQVIDYLLPIGTETPVMVIKRGGREELAWLTYLKPFETDVWYFLFLNSFLLLFGFSLLRQYYTKDQDQKVSTTLRCFFGDFWMLVGANFGYSPKEQPSNQWKAMRLAYFCVFFTGMLTFACYKSSLTAELAVRRDDMPFSTLAHLLESEYRVMTNQMGSATILPLFENSYEKSHLHQLYIRYMEPYKDQFQFGTIEEAMEHLMVTPKRTYLMYLENLHKYRCQVMVAWQTRFPRFLSFGFPKHSPYYQFINYNLLRQQESGLIDLLKQHHMKDPSCENSTEQRKPEDVPIGMKKLISLFFMLFVSFALSVLLLSCEVLLRSPTTRLLSTLESPSHELESQDFLDARLSRLMNHWGIEHDRDAFVREVREICRQKTLLEGKAWPATAGKHF